MNEVGLLIEVGDALQKVETACNSLGYLSEDFFVGIVILVAIMAFILGGLSFGGKR